MSFKWKDFIRLAKELSEKTTDDAAIRSCISRAYYGAFCTARNYCLDQNFIPLSIKTKSIVHQTVPQCLIEYGKEDEFAIANLLKSLRIQRNNADYKESFTITSADLKKRIFEAESVVSQIEEWS